ncbi:predicted protein [Phaeodactylum tricornutum CCAP 1055/1]|jgi:hypothetical protein|uniref:Methyltransferase domain-containing protein n=2 Tax=Phaeodactylum tricornutum TaxID=2850 RepID=B7G874_PHATC|nr:predicted protein [Phaeodactylum tricornutum CCAP 1055/1]EEC44992.1 predicted protein [Phaeodactylum tricornutum CCAP 1055/1]|eukprot:XP_002183292.1 predicted protein [Phaeodactylum tricornutum CCAP 1055/1]
MNFSQPRFARHRSWRKLLPVLTVLSLLSFGFWNCFARTGDSLESEIRKDALGAPNGMPAELSTALAYKQSFGFFDDILDGAWRKMQERARIFIQYSNPHNPNQGQTDSARWYVENLEPDFTCPQVQRVGGHGDGPKWTCDPNRLLKEEPCLIYSVGSAGKYQWEDGLIHLLGGTHCEIHVFDPGAFARSRDVEDKNIHYHQWGFSSSYVKSFVPDIYSMGEASGKPVMKTFQDTLRELGHVHRTIHVLKLDCEGCEWVNYRDWIELDIRQVLIETHQLPDRRAGPGALTPSTFFDEFRKNNFAMFSKEANVIAQGTCVEFGYVKLHPDFWH